MSGRRHLTLAGLAALAAGCVDPFSGSKIEATFYRGVHVAGEDEPGAPPAGTHYELYAVRDGVPFHLINFAIVPTVDIDDPCYIETAESHIPYSSVSPVGLHVAQWYDKLLSLYEADGTVSDLEAGALADARYRLHQVIPLLAANVKAVVSTPYGPPFDDDPSEAEIAAFQAELAAQAPPGAADDAANAARARLCGEWFDRHPLLYTGTDRLITQPLGGLYYGVVDGEDPRNGGWIGGASFDLPDVNVAGLQALRVTWQFDDPQDERAAALGSSPTGYTYMAGTPFELTRGVINVHLEHESFPSIAADVAIWVNLDEDPVFL